MIAGVATLQNWPKTKRKKKEKNSCLEGVDFFSNFIESEKNEQMKEGERKQGK